MHGQQRAERIAVGALVGGQQEALGGAHLLGHLASRSRRVRSPSFIASLSSSSSLEIRTPRSSVSSYWKLKVGVRFIRISRAIFAWSTPCEERRPRASPPALLAAEHADVDARARRSGLVSTAVTVTNPILGSLSSVAIADPITSRITSLTRRIRAVPSVGDYSAKA